MRPWHTGCVILCFYSERRDTLSWLPVFLSFCLAPSVELHSKHRKYTFIVVNVWLPSVQFSCLKHSWVCWIKNLYFHFNLYFWVKMTKNTCLFSEFLSFAMSENKLVLKYIYAWNKKIYLITSNAISVLGVSRFSNVLV